MTKSLDDRLREVFATAFETAPEYIDDDLSVDTSAEWDSIRSIVLASSIEEEFAIEFSDDELVSLDSFNKIRAALVTKGVA